MENTFFHTPKTAQEAPMGGDKGCDTQEQVERMKVQPVILLGYNRYSLHGHESGKVRAEPDPVLSWTTVICCCHQRVYFVSDLVDLCITPLFQWVSSRWNQDLSLSLKHLASSLKLSFSHQLSVVLIFWLTGMFMSCILSMLTLQKKLCSEQIQIQRIQRFR